MNEWKNAKLIRSEMISKDIRSMFFEVENFPTFIAGQHCDIRLTAPDGYQAQRAYSIASAPGSVELEFGVQILPNGEVSSYLDIMKPGEELELKGPIGGHFIWKPGMGVAGTDSPLILIGGGSGIVPLVSIARQFLNSGSTQKLLFIISVKTLEDLAWRDEILKYHELNENITVELFLTQDAPEGWGENRVGRINSERITQILSEETNWQAFTNPLTYICGRNPFVESMAKALTSLGLDPTTIKTERYG